ncbi:MAG: hypothetical protein A2V70_16370 [Planctomycetes bacterium RBG_13_63_9]|nr:MAG: hypothetical protein A2V70_16370 [Planctomycetes bacterium RBG_13_63_9]
MIDLLGDLGIVAHLCQNGRRQGQGEQPFLCFERRSPGDVLVGGVKIAGSAQRRRRGAVLQHGSVLLGRSPAAPELPALGDLARNAPAAGELVDAWSRELAAALAITWRRARLSAEQRRRAAELVEDRYASARWTRHRRR